MLLLVFSVTSEFLHVYCCLLCEIAHILLHIAVAYILL